jgi:mono/diheme cytochrome c family protein
MTRAEHRWVRLLTMTLLLEGAAVALDCALARDTGAPATSQHSSERMASAHPPGDETRGEELYNASCVVCHGAGATGGIGPRLAGNPVLSKEEAFWRMLSEGRHMMPPLRDALTDQQLADIHAWLQTLR